MTISAVEAELPYTEFDFILRKAHLIRTQAATQNSLATAGTNFTTGVQNKVDPCRAGAARNGQMVNDLETAGVIFLTRNAFVWVVRSNMHHNFMT